MMTVPKPAGLTPMHGESWQYLCNEGAEFIGEQPRRLWSNWQMVWRGSVIDPMEDVAAPAVLDAFDAARRAGEASVDCYRAGVEAWRQTHPDQSAEYAAKQAVAVILAAKVSLRVEE